MVEIQFLHLWDLGVLNKFTDLSELLRAYELRSQLSADLISSSLLASHTMMLMRNEPIETKKNGNAIV